MRVARRFRSSAFPPGEMCVGRGVGLDVWREEVGSDDAEGVSRGLFCSVGDRFWLRGAGAVRAAQRNRTPAWGRGGLTGGERLTDWAGRGEGFGAEPQRTQGAQGGMRWW